MKTRLIKIATVVFSVAFMIVATTSCTQKRAGWSLRGNIEGAADSTAYIEEPSGTAWVIVDSVKIGSDGDFEFTAKTPLTNRRVINRLRIHDRAVYFPVSGTDNITLTAAYDDMDTRHTLSGTEAADGVNRADSIIAATVARVGESAAVNDAQMLNELGNIILNDTTCIVGYYIVKRPIGKTAVFTTDNRLKLGLIGAVATRYKTLRPNDPLGKELEFIYNNARNGKRPGATMEAQEIGRPQVVFVGKDENGYSHDLDKVLDSGKVTIVNLVRYGDAKSAANTAVLGELNQKYGARGLTIYQIGFDANEAYWRQNATGMPWTTVYGVNDEAIEFLKAYNTNPLEGNPISLIFNRRGEIVDRVTDSSKLEAAVTRLL